MKTSRRLPALAALFLIALLAALPRMSHADARAWRADLASEDVHNEYVRRGDSATLRVAVYLRGREYRPTAAVVRYRAGLDSPDWLQAPCAVSSNVVEITWTPMLAPGADVVPMLVHVDGEVYRVPVMLYVRDSPDGDDPGALPVIDFADYSVANAPWLAAEADPLFVEWSNTNSLLRHAASIATYDKPVRFTVENVRAGETTVLNNRVKFFGRTFMLPPGVDDPRDVGDGLFAMFTGPETAVLVRVNNGLDPDENRDYVSSGEFGFDYDLYGWPSVEFLGEEYKITTERSPVATDADVADALSSAQRGSAAVALAATNYTDAAVAAATNAIPAPDLSALPPAPDITLGGTNLVGLLPEYIAAPETVRTNVYTGVSRDAELRDGKLVLLYLATQPSGAFSLNLQLANGTWTGAKAVRFWGTSGAGTQISAGSIIHIVYRGGAWYWSDRDTNNDTYDRVRINQEIRAASAIGRNSLCGADTNGMGYVKLAPGAVIDPAMPLLYLNRTTTLSAGSRDTQFYAVYNIGTTLLTYHGVAGKQRSPLYLMGELSADGRAFTVGDPAFSYEPKPPCFPLGLFHAATTNSFYFIPGPLISGQTGGDASAVTNLVSDLLSEEVDALPVQSTLEVHRLVLSDLWDRVDRMAGASDADAIEDILLALDGLDARLTALEGAASVNAVRMSEIAGILDTQLSGTLQVDSGGVASDRSAGEEALVRGDVAPTSD